MFSFQTTLVLVMLLSKTYIKLSVWHTWCSYNLQFDFLTLLWRLSAWQILLGLLWVAELHSFKEHKHKKTCRQWGCGTICLWSYSILSIHLLAFSYSQTFLGEWWMSRNLLHFDLCKENYDKILPLFQSKNI